MAWGSLGHVAAAELEADEYVADVLVLGGGPAGAWAALMARAGGAEVILADKGYLGTSGATAPSNTETWVAAPGRARETAVARHLVKTGGLADAGHIEDVLAEAWAGLHAMVEWKHPFALDAEGRPYLGNLRGPDYMRFLRRRLITAGVRVLDHHPALELLGGPDGVGGAAGIDRQRGNRWQVRSGAVVLATGGCAFGERMLGATGLTGDGHLMAAEAGAAVSGMEMSSQYAVTPKGTSLNKGMPFRFASFFDAQGRDLGKPGEDRQEFIAEALQRGTVLACLDKAGPQVQAWLRRGQPNCLLPFDRAGIDPFKDRFEITLRCEGTVRGVGGLRLTGPNGETGVPGLYAAGDVASREDLVGAISGGGGPNSSWAIASGRWAGVAAARASVEARRRRDRQRLSRLGGVGLSPAGRGRPDAAAVVAEVSGFMLPLATNFKRSGAALGNAARWFDALWREVGSREPEAVGRRRAPVDDASAPIAIGRAAAAMLMAARWAVASAEARQETRGMHRRADHPAIDPAAPRRLVARGLDRIEIEIEDAPAVTESGEPTIGGPA